LPRKTDEGKKPAPAMNTAASFFKMPFSMRVYL